MKTYFTIQAILLAVAFVPFSEADQKQLDEESLRSYMAGEYDLIGRKADSIITYNGLEALFPIHK